MDQPTIPWVVHWTDQYSLWTNPDSVMIDGTHYTVLYRHVGLIGKVLHTKCQVEGLTCYLR